MDTQKNGSSFCLSCRPLLKLLTLRKASLELSSVPTLLLGRGAERGRSVERSLHEGKDEAVVSMVRLVAKGTRLQEPWV